MREVKEETGLTVETGSVAFVDSIFEEREEDAFQGIRIVYYANIKEGTLEHEKSGTTDLCSWHNTTIDKTLLVDLAAAGLEYLMNKNNPD